MDSECLERAFDLRCETDESVEIESRPKLDDHLLRFYDTEERYSLFQEEHEDQSASELNETVYKLFSARMDVEYSTDVLSRDPSLVGALYMLCQSQTSLQNDQYTCSRFKQLESEVLGRTSCFKEYLISGPPTR